MAVIYSETTLANGSVEAIWSGLSESDSSPPRFKCPAASGKCVHVKGTFAGGTVAIKGNNFDGFAGAAPVRRAHDGASMTFTGEDGGELMENYLEFYPLVTAGAGVSVDVAIVAIPLHKW